MAVESLRYANEMKHLSSSQFHQRCETSSNELLESIQQGERVCTLHLYSPQKVCEVLNKYSHIYWFGNSLTRQTLMALHSLLSSNLHSINKYTTNNRYPQFDTPAKDALQQCQCDGQFSVHTVCRQPYRLQDLSEGIVNACSDIMGESFWKTSFQFQYYQLRQTKELQIDRCLDNGDVRPVFLFFQGGNVDVPVSGSRHNDGNTNPKEFDIPLFFQHTLHTFITQYEYFYQNCPNGKLITLHIVFSGVNAQNQHPKEEDDSTSSIENLLGLNSRLLEYMQKWHPQVKILNFFNLTMSPHADSADGYHYLTATNVQKAMALLRLMEIEASS
jgi:hypothetical protein